LISEVFNYSENLPICKYFDVMRGKEEGGDLGLEGRGVGPGTSHPDNPDKATPLAITLAPAGERMMRLL
jgi:hypothetical protein